jgi:protein-S-isoprenylcysteine O-methyltransferase Ste14
MGPTASPRQPPALRLSAGGLWDVLAGHVAPAAVFALLLLNQASRARDAIVAAVGHGASPTGALRAANSALVVAYFALLAGLYLFRLPARGADRRPGIVAASFVATFMVMCVPYLPAAGRRDWLLPPADLVTLLGIGCAVWSLAYLRRSFAILPQARRLVTGGPYALSRNPLYVGEVLGAWSVYLPTMSWAALLALAVNVTLLLVRVRAEERVLAGTFGDEYVDYCRRVPRFLPNPRRLLREARAGVERERRRERLSTFD